MASYFNYLYVLITLAFIISSGIHIFSRGFLLSRDATTEKRHCDKFFINLEGNHCLSDDKVMQSYNKFNVTLTLMFTCCPYF